jgi:hypothetical protein
MSLGQRKIDARFAILRFRHLLRKPNARFLIIWIVELSVSLAEFVIRCVK